ncbi:MAG: ATP-dependent Clp protease adaptor ClpS [Helicobacter sp.]|nr:ATP-dependent Clp protease adaptor ClpS [Helicobacter sp.]
MPSNAQFETHTQTHTEVWVQEPKRYRVVLLNDDYSTQDFVIEVLQKIFGKNVEDSVNLMLQIHHNGRGVCGIYPYDIAETKVAQVHKMAKDRQYPLRAILEKVE